MEKGFYHPEVGYWQTIGEVSSEILARFPEGTIEVGLPPSSNMIYKNGVWVEIKPTPLTQDQIDGLRRAAYQSESDPLFFKYQREEIEKQVWLDKVEEIRQRYPEVS